MAADADFIILDARIDLKNWNKAIAQMEADARNIESQTILVNVKVNDSGLKSIQSQLDKVDTDITADVKFTTSGDDIANLREQWDDPLVAKVKFEQTGDDIVSLRDLLDDTIQTDVKFKRTGDDIAGMLDDLTDVTVDVKANEDASVDSTIGSVEKKLNELKTLAKIELILNAAEFVKGVEALPLVGALVEIEELSHRVVGQTGRDLENVGRTINNVWTGNWGESKDEIANVVTTVAQMRDTSGDFLVEAGNIEDVTVGAFQAASVGGAETTEVLRAASQMVKNGFVPSFQEAFDLIAEGYSRGFNQSGDFLDTLIEYSSTYSQLGISANGFFNILRGGTEAGVFNTDKMADAFKEMLNLTKEEVAIYQELGDETDRTRALTEAGLMDEAAAYTAGEITGDEFSQAVIDTLVAKFEDPAEQQRLAKAIFSPTMVEDAGLPALLQADMTENNIWKGQAKALSDEIFSGPGSAFTTMQRTLETYFLNALINSVEAQDFMDRITIAAQRFGTELTEGATIGEALEVALEIPGLGDTLRQMESAFGNIAIVMLEVAASIGETFGMNVEGLRQDIERFAEGQFVFDIQTAETADELQARMTSAINRGVEESKLAELTGQAVQERLDIGDIEGAQALVDAIGQIPDLSRVVTQLSADAQRAVQSLGPEQAKTSLQMGAGLLSGDAWEQRQRDIALLSEIPLFDPAQLQAQVDGYVSQLNQDLQAAFSSGDFDAALMIGEQLGIQNIGQLVSKQKIQSGIDAMYPAPVAADFDQFIADSFLGLQNALLNGDYAEASAFAEKLMDADNPSVQAAVNDFATTLMVQFNNALAVGDTETATDILTIMGLSPEANAVALDSMTQRLADFSADSTYEVNQVTNGFDELGNMIDTTKERGSTGIDQLYGAVLSDRGVLGITRLDSLAKRFDAVADAIKGALEEIKSAENKVGSGAIEGMQVGGVGHAGITMVGEGGRELITADERFAVLNNQTTERLYTALHNMAGVTNTTSNSQRTINYQPTIYVQNQAQAALFGGQSLDQLRGEAF